MIKRSAWIRLNHGKTNILVTTEITGNSYKEIFDELLSAVSHVEATEAVIETITFFEEKNNDN